MKGNKLIPNKQLALNAVDSTVPKILRSPSHANSPLLEFTLSAKAAFHF